MRTRECAHGPRVRGMRGMRVLLRLSGAAPGALKTGVAAAVRPADSKQNAMSSKIAKDG